MTKKVPLLRMTNIHKWFGKTYALKRVDFEIYPGEALGLIGDNGAGKSTLIKIIAGVVSKNEGEIYWKGRKLENHSANDARKLGIETVFQEQALIDCFSINQNIFLGRELTMRLHLLDYKKMRQESSELMERLNLSLPNIDQEVRFCSGGEKQGVVIARALHFNAELVVLDEPTRALSIVGVEQVKQFIKGLKKSNIACIFISHNFYHVYPAVDKFVIFSQGEKKLEIEKKKVSTIEALEDMMRSLTK